MYILEWKKLESIIMEKLAGKIERIQYIGNTCERDVLIFLVLFQMFEAGFPITPIPFAFFPQTLFAHGFVIVKETCLLRVCGFEPVFVVLYLHRTFRPYSFRELHRLSVLLFVCTGMFRNEIELQILILSSILCKHIKV